MTKEIGNSDLIDSWAANGTISEPDLSKKNSGWLSGERPAFQYFNWLFNRIFKDTNYLKRRGVADWNATTTYEQNDITNSGGILYKALRQTINDLPSSSPSDWGVVSETNLEDILIDEDDFASNVSNKAPTQQSTKAYVDGKTWETGDVAIALTTLPKTGWIFIDNQTLGDTGSGAALLGATYEQLFYFYWNNFDNTAAPVSSGRGASAAADWAAGKTITIITETAISTLSVGKYMQKL